MWNAINDLPVMIINLLQLGVTGVEESFLLTVRDCQSDLELLFAGLLLLEKVWRQGSGSSRRDKRMLVSEGSTGVLKIW